MPGDPSLGFRSFEKIDEGASPVELASNSTACCRRGSKVPCGTSRRDAVPQCVSLDSVTKSGGPAGFIELIGHLSSFCCIVSRTPSVFITRATASHMEARVE